MNKSIGRCVAIALRVGAPGSRRKRPLGGDPVFRGEFLCAGQHTGAASYGYVTAVDYLRHAGQDLEQPPFIRAHAIQR
jgi:hypothetical protein